MNIEKIVKEKLLAKYKDKTKINIEYKNINDNYLYTENDKIEIENIIERNQSINSLYQIAQGYKNSLSLKEAFEIIDIDKNRFKENLIALSKSDLKPSLVGMGGINFNILSIIKTFIKENNIEDRINILINSTIEFDKFSLDNLPRIYDLNHIKDYHKGNNFRKFKTGEYVRELKEIKAIDIVGGIKIGAIDLQTRKNIYDTGYGHTLLNALHTDDEIAVITNLKVTGLEVETYGKINITIFLLNVMKLTDFLLNYLKEIDYKVENIDKKVDNMIFHFNAKEYLKNKFKKKIDNLTEIKTKKEKYLIDLN